MRNTLRTFATSADARAAGYSTRDWLRAWTPAEHRARIAREVAHREAGFTFRGMTAEGLACYRLDGHPGL